MKQKRKLGKIKTKNGVVRDRIEDSIDLQDYVEFSCLPGSPGAALLAENKNIQFKYAFAPSGINPTNNDESFASILSYLQNAVKSFPAGETFTIVQTTRPNNKNRLEYFQKLADNAPSPLFREFVASAAAPGEYFVNQTLEDRINTARQRYKKKNIIIYVTATATTSSIVNDKTEAVIRKAMNMFSGVWSNWTGETETVMSRQLRDVFVNAQAVYQDWKTVLTQSKLNFLPLTVEEMVAEQWVEFNQTPVRELPQKMIWDGRDLNYVMKDDLHISSWFFDSQISVPKATKDYVYQQFPDGDMRVSSVVSLRNKPADWLNPTAAMLYLYGKTTELEDCKIVMSCRKASSQLAEKNVELLQRQAEDALKGASKRNLPATRSVRLQQDAESAANSLYDGDVPLKMSLCVCISKRSLKELKIACRRLQSQFMLPATLEIEQDYVSLSWLQCFPQLSYKSPFFKPYDRSRAYNASNIPAFMPIVQTTSPNKDGLEFITEDERIPFYISIEREIRHLLFLAATRGGKSLLFAQILMIAMCAGMPMTVIDYPREDGESTFGPITHLAGEDGAYLNIAEESNNFFELPDLSQFDREEQQQRMGEARDYVTDLLMIILFGANAAESSSEHRDYRNIIGNVLNAFYENSDIDRRLKAAVNAPIETPEWRDVPTLKDFSALCTQSTLETILETVTSDHVKIINSMRLRFESFIQTTVGRSLSQPTSIPRDARLLVFAFKGVSNNDDAAVLMASAAAAAMRRTLSAPASILFLDEASILSKFESLMAQIAKIAANGAKSGIRLMMALQTPASIFASKYGADILANISTKFIGRINSEDIGSYEKLNINRNELIANASKSFYPNVDELYSRWLIIDRAESTYVRSYAPPLLLAAVANNPKEEEAKAAFLKAYGDPIEALKAFAIEWIQAMQEGRDFNLPDIEKPYEQPSTDIEIQNIEVKEETYVA